MECASKKLSDCSWIALRHIMVVMCLLYGHGNGADLVDVPGRRTTLTVVDCRVFCRFKDFGRNTDLAMEVSCTSLVALKIRFALSSSSSCSSQQASDPNGSENVAEDTFQQQQSFSPPLQFQATAALIRVRKTCFQWCFWFQLVPATVLLVGFVSGPLVRNVTEKRVQVSRPVRTDSSSLMDSARLVHTELSRVCPSSSSARRLSQCGEQRVMMDPWAPRSSSRRAERPNGGRVVRSDVARKHGVQFGGLTENASLMVVASSS